MLFRTFLILLTCTMYSLCAAQDKAQLYVLGIAQDGGYPQSGCRKSCCSSIQDAASPTFRTSLALADPVSGKWWLFEATPDLGRQLELFSRLTEGRFAFLPHGIFLTHAHIGHYTGLMELGREVMHTKQVPVYAFPRMIAFLTSQGPWSQLVQLNNIRLINLEEDKPVTLTPSIKVTGFSVPHRDEFSETIGLRMETGERKYLFIPDIDKWSRWNRSIADEVNRVDEAYLDATFYSSGELPNRNMSEIPHPLVIETVDLLDKERNLDHSKVRFIHMNHTNPLLQHTAERRNLEQKGYRVAEQAYR